MNKVFLIENQRIQVQHIPQSQCPGCQLYLQNLSLFAEIHTKLLSYAKKGIIKPSYAFSELHLAS